MPLVEQEMFILPDHLSSSMFCSGVVVVLGVQFYAFTFLVPCYDARNDFCTHKHISVLRFMASDYSFDFLKFLDHCIFRPSIYGLLTTTLVSSIYRPSIFLPFNLCLLTTRLPLPPSPLQTLLCLISYVVNTYQFHQHMLVLNRNNDLQNGEILCISGGLHGASISKHIHI